MLKVSSDPSDLFTIKDLQLVCLKGGSDKIGA